LLVSSYEISQKKPSGTLESPIDSPKAANIFIFCCCIATATPGAPGGDSGSLPSKK
jgi:hypothetical protein